MAGEIAIVTIDPETGDVELDLKGFHGKGCHAIQEAVSKALGGDVTATKQKPEYHSGGNVMKKVIATLSVLLALVSVGIAQSNLPDAPQPQPQTQPAYVGTEVHNDFGKPLPAARDHHAWEYTFAAISVAEVFADRYDIVNSEKAYKVGYVESNTFLVCGETAVCRPSSAALAERDLVEYAISAAPAVAAHIFRHKSDGVNALSWGFLSGPSVVVIKHIQGGNLGKKDWQSAQ